MRVGSEERLAAKVHMHMAEQGWDVYQEVTCGGRADLVGLRGPLIWVIECKTRLGLAVVDQARFWLGKAHLVSVATPYSRVSSVLREYMEWRGIGWLKVDEYSDRVTEEEAPALRRRIDQRLRNVLRPEHRTFCPAGSSSGGHYTAFKETCRKVAAHVALSPGVSVRELLDAVTTHYRSKASARNSIVHWVSKGKVPGVVLRHEGKTPRLYPGQG